MPQRGRRRGGRGGSCPPTFESWGAQPLQFFTSTHAPFLTRPPSSQLAPTPLCHRQRSDRVRPVHKTHGVKISKSSRIQIFAALYFVVLIFAFWLWVAKIMKIWTSQKFSGIWYVKSEAHTHFICKYLNI